MTKRAVFLDRDGTLNEERGYLRQVADLVLIPGAAQAIRKLNDAGVLAILTTNQSGAARGFYGEDHVRALNRRLEALLWEEGEAKLDAVFYCPHHPRAAVEAYQQACRCRKPETGMIEAALERFPDIDRAGSFVVGDKATDIAFAANARCRGILLKTGYGERVLAGKYQTLTHPPAAVCQDVREAVTWILSQ